MPVSFLTATQRSNYGRYAGIPTPEELARYSFAVPESIARRERRRCETQQTMMLN